jgi:hypothetical protein
MGERISFYEYYKVRKQEDEIKLWELSSIKKAYFVGAYARAVVISSLFSIVRKGNTTFKNWLSNQIINYRNLDRIFEITFRFEQKLKLNIRNDSEVRHLAHEIPIVKAKGVSNSKISYAFVAGFDDYRKYLHENPLEKQDYNKSKEKE